MGVKIKEKKEKRIFPLREIPAFVIALNKLLIPTLGDEKRLKGVEETLRSIQENHQQVVAAFFEKHQLPETEVIDQTHPLFEDFNEFYFKEIKEPDFPEFTENQFASITSGVVLTFGDKKMLEYWLLKK